MARSGNAPSNPPPSFARKSSSRSRESTWRRRSVNGTRPRRPARSTRGPVAASTTSRRCAPRRARPDNKGRHLAVPAAPRAPASSPAISARAAALADASRFGWVTVWASNRTRPPVEGGDVVPGEDRRLLPLTTRTGSGRRSRRSRRRRSPGSRGARARQRVLGDVGVAVVEGEPDRALRDAASPSAPARRRRPA